MTHLAPYTYVDAPACPPLSNGYPPDSWLDALIVLGAKSMPQRQIVSIANRAKGLVYRGSYLYVLAPLLRKRADIFAPGRYVFACSRPSLRSSVIRMRDRHTDRVLAAWAYYAVDLPADYDPTVRAMRSPKGSRRSRLPGAATPAATVLAPVQAPVQAQNARIEALTTRLEALEHAVRRLELASLTPLGR